MSSEIAVDDFVRDRKGILYKVLAVGSVAVVDENGKAEYGVAEVVQIEDHVDDSGRAPMTTLRGTKSLRYTVDLFPDGVEYPIDMTFRFRSRVKADDPTQAAEAFRTALYERLTWDGDEEAPGPLAEMTMTPVTVRRGVATGE